MSYDLSCWCILELNTNIQTNILVILNHWLHSHVKLFIEGRQWASYVFPQKLRITFLLQHTLFMTKSRYGKKMIRSFINHRTCNWWRRNHPDQRVRIHRSGRNHYGMSVTSDGMVVHRKPGEQFSLASAMHSFFSWLQNFDTFFVVADNGWRFDFFWLQKKQ